MQRLMRPCTEGPWQGRPAMAPLRPAMPLTSKKKTGEQSIRTAWHEL